MKTPTQKLKTPTQKQIAELFGVSENTIVNWKKPLEQKNEVTGEIARYYLPNGRHNLVRACKLYAALEEQDEDANTQAEELINAIENIIITCKNKESLKSSLEILEEFKYLLEDISSVKSL